MIDCVQCKEGIKESYWKSQCLFSDSYTSLVEQILDFDVTENNVREVVDSDPDETKFKSFAAIRI